MPGKVSLTVDAGDTGSATPISTSSTAVTMNSSPVFNAEYSASNLRD